MASLLGGVEIRVEAHLALGSLAFAFMMHQDLALAETLTFRQTLGSAEEAFEPARLFRLLRSPLLQSSPSCRS